MSSDCSLMLMLISSSSGNMAKREPALELRLPVEPVFECSAAEGIGRRASAILQWAVCVCVTAVRERSEEVKK